MRQAPQRQREPFNEFSVVCYDIETIVDDAPEDDSFPPWPRHRPVAAAFLAATWSPAGYEFNFRTLMCAPGEEPDFYGRVEQMLPPGATAVTFNGRGFDSRVLSMSMKHRFDLPNIAAHAFASRFSASHCDLADELGGMGAARPVKLAEFARALDIPCKLSTDGGEVGRLWRAGDYKTVANYVGEDVLGTYLLWLHFIAFQRSDERLMVLPLAEISAWIEATPGLSHLRPFAECPPARLARVRAPALRAAAALADAQLRLKKQREQEAFASPF